MNYDSIIFYVAELRTGSKGDTIFIIIIYNYLTKKLSLLSLHLARLTSPFYFPGEYTARPFCSSPLFRKPILNPLNAKFYLIPS